MSHDPSRRVVLASATASLVGTSAAQAQAGRIDFTQARFTPALTGGGPTPAWTLVDDEGRKVLAQTSTDKTDYRFPLAIFEQSAPADLAVTVRFKAVAGDVDRAGGIAFRLRDANNYYVVRANALEDNVRLYRVVKGQRIQFAGANIKVPSGSWQELAVLARGDRFEVLFNGKSLYSATDKTFAGAGRVALWTKADSVTHFDNLTIGTP
jgi:hypothetical protein